MDLKNILNLILSGIFLLLTVTFSISAKKRTDHKVMFIIGAIVCVLLSIALASFALTPKKQEDGPEPKKSIY